MSISSSFVILFFISILRKKMDLGSQKQKKYRLWANLKIKLNVVISKILMLIPFIEFDDLPKRRFAINDLMLNHLTQRLSQGWIKNFHSAVVADGEIINFFQFN